MQDSDNKYLLFYISRTLYAIGFSDVRLIIAAEKTQPLPDFPDYAEGTLVNGGKTYTIIDLRKRFGCAHRRKDEHECIILLDSEKLLGLHCDSISGFVEVQPEDIQPPPDINEQVNARFISGSFLNEGKTVCIISPELVIRPDDEAKFNEVQADG
ncbi:MAG: chemotaxis protein CheW [Ruminococcus sp.]|nr:chemotaxis protein CheW [Ruminococcus sp.]MBP3796382.1 chemotaxis protein CheW [Ruminococcus sp.]